MAARLEGNLTTYAIIKQAGNDTNSSHGLQSMTPSYRYLTSSQISVIVKCTVLLGMVFVGIFGNTLVLIAYKTTPRLWTRSNTLVASLAVIDILETGPTLAYYIAYQLLVYVFHNDECKYRTLVAVLTPIQRMPSKIIASSMVAIAFERFVAIVYPFHYETIITDRTIRIMIASCWSYAIVITVFSYSWLARTDWTSCGPAYPVMLFGAIDLTTFSLTVLALFGIYARILLVALKHRSLIYASEEQMERRNQATATTTTTTTTTTEVGISKAETAKKRRSSFRGTQTTLAIVCPYLVFWQPFMIGRAIQASGNQSHFVGQMLDIGLALGVTCQSIDWIIYCFSNRDFRNAFKRILILKSLRPTANYSEE